MFVHKSHFFIRSISTLTPTTAKRSLNWRNKIEKTQLASEISSILLQRNNWASLLHSLNLSSRLTPYIFLQVLHKTQTNPQISLKFFTWAQSNLGFEPDLRTLSKLTQVLIRFGLPRAAQPILDSLIQTHQTIQIADSLIHSCKGTDSQSLVLSYLLECYCKKGFYLQSLEVFRLAKYRGYVLSVHSCNALLCVLEQENQIRLAWYSYAAVLRNGFLPDQNTWSTISRMLCKDGKFERLVRILDMGVRNSVIYNLCIDYSSKRGNFEDSFAHLNEMCNKKLHPGFGTYSSILDGACKYDNSYVIETVVGSMVDKGLLPKILKSEYDLIIQKLSDLRMTNAAYWFFRRACDEQIELREASYGCLLRAFSADGRVTDAIKVYRDAEAKGIVINDGCYSAFVNALCDEDSSEEASELMRDMIGRGFSPSAEKLSRFISSQCDKHRWRDAEELLNAILEKGLLPCSFSCCSLVKHYCFSRRIDSAMALHHKIEKLESTLDVTTYEVLLNGLFKEKRGEEAVCVFDHMRRQSLVSSRSCITMITGLCRERKLREAMKVHDEMLKMGLKPEGRTYKRLIFAFK